MTEFQRFLVIPQKPVIKAFKHFVVPIFVAVTHRGFGRALVEFYIRQERTA